MRRHRRISFAARRRKRTSLEPLEGMANLVDIMLIFA